MKLIAESELTQSWSKTTAHEYIWLGDKPADEGDGNGRPSRKVTVTTPEGASFEIDHGIVSIASRLHGLGTVAAVLFWLNNFFYAVLWVLLAASALFLCAALGMGLLISTVAKNQFIAGQVAILSTFLPAFILSGFIFNIGSMPAPIRVLTHAIAARYFVAILQTVFLAGNIWSVIGVNALALALIAGFFLAQVRRLTRKRLE